MRYVRRGTLAFVLLASASAGAQAPSSPPAAAPTVEVQATRPPEIPSWRFVLSDLTVYRYNETGIENQMRVGIQKRLYESDKPISRDNFLHVGVYPKLNPAYVKIGPSIELQPVSVFNLRVAAEFVDYFSTFGYLQSFQTPTANYSPDARKVGEDLVRNYATTGAHVTIEPTLQFKFGPIAVRDKLSIEYWRMRLHGADASGRPDTVFYDATLDTLVPGNGWTLANDLDVLYQRKTDDNGQMLSVGARYTLVHPFYDASMFKDGEDASYAKNAHMRLGVVGAFTFFDHGYTRFNKPTLLMIVSWYLQHEYRGPGCSSDCVNAAIPYIVAGFSFQSDLMQ